jgi:hypothetical protein
VDVTLVPRAPRKQPDLRAVYDDGKNHHEGRVRDLSTSGLFVECEAELKVGTAVAVVILTGGFDGERVYAEVARVDRGKGFALHFAGLDAGRRQRLRALRDGIPAEKAGLLARNVEPLEKVPPADAPVILLTGGPEDALGDPTGHFDLPVEGAPPPPPVEVAPSPFEIPSPLATATRGPSAAAGAPPAGAGLGAPGDLDDESIEAQLVELGRRTNTLTEENARLRQEVERLKSQLALKAAVEEELAEALERIDELEKRGG